MHGEVPKIPDSEKLASVNQLCAIAEPYREENELFVSAMREIVEWHRVHSSFYRSLLEKEELDPQTLKNISDLARIPLIPAEFFKLHEIPSLPKEKLSLTLTSSGTSGQKSQMFFDEWSIKAPQSMLARQIEYNGWSTPNEPANYLLYTYEVDSDTKLGTSYTDLFLCGFAPVNRLTFALKRTGTGGHDFDVFGCIRALEEYARDKFPVRIFGFPAFLYFTLKRMKDLRMPSLTLPEKSFIFLGGGWKGQAGKAISSEDLRTLVSETLGIPPENVRDGFGAVEHCIPYVECKNHKFHVPSWSRVFIRDFRTLEPVGFNKPGFLHFVSPYITSVPAHSVMMGDVGTLQEGKECSCGIRTPFFKVQGRAGTSKNKSCAIAAAELLRDFA